MGNGQISKFLRKGLFSMNFFMVGSFFMLFMLNADWASNYAVKLVGFIFFVLGTMEAADFTDAFSHIKKPAVTSAAMCAVAFAAQLLMKLLKPAAMASNIISILLFAATLYMSLNVFRMFVNALDSHRELVDDVSHIVRLQSNFNKLAIFTIINFCGDVLNRLIPLELFTTLGGVVTAISKILIYIFLLILLFSFNKLRTDFDKRQERTSDQ